MRSLKYLFLFLAVASLALLGCKKEKQNPTGGGGGGGTSASCTDGVMNGGELAIDCGGDCPPCECPSTVTDINGNTYPVITIGGQCWMRENLKTIHYNDGEEILHVIDDSPWISMTEGAYCFFNNDDSNGPNYGLLYNWHAVNTGKLCPQGWHIPTAEEWEILGQYVEYDGGALKAVALWSTPNAGATNSSGFTALPGGSRVGGGAFVGIDGSAYFYSSSEGSNGNVYSRSLFYNDANFYTNAQPKDFGYSCRCVKDAGNGSSDNPGYNCVSGNCESVSTGAQYSTLTECLNACEDNSDCNLEVSIASSGNSATASASGGTPPYNYNWSNGDTGPTVTGLAPGNYTVTASEVADPTCTATASVTIENTSSDNCCDCTGIGFDCDECCDGEFDMLGESWATWEAIYTSSGCDCN